MDDTLSFTDQHIRRILARESSQLSVVAGELHALCLRPGHTIRSEIYECILLAIASDFMRDEPFTVITDDGDGNED